MKRLFKLNIDILYIVNDRMSLAHESLTKLPLLTVQKRRDFSSAMKRN